MSRPGATPAALLERLIDETGADQPDRCPMASAIMAERLFRLSQSIRYLPLLFQALLFVAFWDILQIWQMVLIATVNVAGTLWFDRLRRGFAGRKDRFADPRYWTSRFALASIVTGSSWGLLGWFAFAPDDFRLQIWLGFALGGLITLTVLTRSAHLPSYYAFLISTVAPPMAMCFLESSSTSLLIAFSGLVFCTFTSIWTHNAYHRENRAAALKLRNAELLYEVDKARAMAETARSIAEENYRRTLDSLQNAQRIGNVGNWDWDAASGSLFWSDQLYRLLGAEPGAFQPSLGTFLNYAHPDDRDSVLAGLKAVCQHSVQSTMEFRIIAPNGEIRTLFAVIETVVGRSGELVRIAGMLRDITAQRTHENALVAAKAEAERANLAKTNFLGNLSHELRTPLNAVIGFSELLTMPHMHQAGDGTVAEYSGMILKSSRHLLTLIDDLLDIAQIESGRLSLHLETVDISMMVADAVAQVRAALRSGDCGLVVGNIAASVSADRRRLLQVTTILLEEAVRLSPSGNVLALMAEIEGAMLRLTLTSRHPLPAFAALSANVTPLQSFERHMPYETGDLGLRLALMQELLHRQAGVFHTEAAGDSGMAIHMRLPVTGVA